MSTKNIEDKIRDLINWVAVMKEEEVEGVTTKISPEAAELLVKKLAELAEFTDEECGCDSSEHGSEDHESDDDEDEEGCPPSACGGCSGCY